MSSRRELSVAVLGATGVTGRQAVRYLYERAPVLGVRWAIAGRDRGRLERLLQGDRAGPAPELVHADPGDPASLRVLAERTSVLVNFAGPFTRLAPAVIAACVEAGTHYVDVSGEIGFLARTIERHHEQARERGVRVVQAAGIEALPFDLLTRLGMERLGAEHGEPAGSADLVMTYSAPPGMPRLSDTLSAGTVASLGEWLRDDAATFGDPAALLGDLADAAAVRRISPIQVTARRDPRHGRLAPMVPSPEINPPVIHRSVALAGHPPLSYREGVALESLVGSRAAQAVLAGVLGAANLGARRIAAAPRPVRGPGATLYQRLVPHSRSGPRPDRIEAWRWAIEGTFRGAGGGESRARVEGRGHTGYLATSRMTAEAGLLLADPEADLPGEAGCLTPAAALGTAELARFEAAGLRFEPA